jgi:hypothetical protein
VLLNIGLDIGVISPALFTMLVLMALITTFMTAPVLEWVYFSRLLPQAYGPAEVQAQRSVAEPISGGHKHGISTSSLAD